MGQTEFYRADKHCHFISSLAACLWNGEIIYLETGGAGRSTDQNILNNSNLIKNQQKYFSHNQKMLSDGGFSSIITYYFNFILYNYNFTNFNIKDSRLVSPIQKTYVQEFPDLIFPKKKHASKRIIIENVFCFVERFRAINFRNRNKLIRQIRLVIAAFNLSNIQLKLSPLRIQVFDEDEELKQENLYQNIFQME